MNFAKYLKRNNFVELDSFPPQIGSSHQHRSRPFRDPFEGDPFKIQSLNFRYADKPFFYPVSNRGKGLANLEKSQVRNIYYNHDHTIPKCNKENLPFGHARQSNNVRKSSSNCSFSAASKVRNTEKAIISESRIPRVLNKESVEQRKNPMTNRFELNRSKTFISTSAQPMLSKCTLKPGSTLKVNEPLTGINVDHNGSCHITININGVASDQVHIKKSDENVEANLTKPKEVRKSKSPKTLSPHALKPSRSYVIHRDDTKPDIRESNLQREPSKNDLKNSSTLSMIPHREEKCTRTSHETNMSHSIPDTITAYSGVSSGSLSRNCSQAVFPNRSLERHASLLKRILSNNPVVVPPKERASFTRSKSYLDPRRASSTKPGNYSFCKTNSKSF